MARTMYANVIGRRTSSTDSDFDGLFESLADIRVSVRLAGLSTFATIYDSETTATSKANPFSTTDGRVEFWAERGNYDIVFEDVTTANRIPARTYRWSPVNDRDLIDERKRVTGQWNSTQDQFAPATYYNWASELQTASATYMERVSTWAGRTNGGIKINKTGIYLVTATAYCVQVPGQGAAQSVTLNVNNVDALDTSYLNTATSAQDIGHKLMYHGDLTANDVVGVVSHTVSTSAVLPSRLRITHLGDI